jgi:hypothetical protein
VKSGGSESGKSLKKVRKGIKSSHNNGSLDDDIA